MAQGRAQAARQLETKTSQRDTALARLRARKPAERTVMLILDDDVADAHDTAKSELFIAKQGTNALARRQAERKLAEAEKKLTEASVKFTFCSRGRLAYEELVRAHPPTEEDVEEATKLEINQSFGLPDNVKPPFNMRTFPPALISMSLVEPELTADEIDELSKTQLSSGEFGMFFQTCLSLHTQARVAELEK